MTISLMSAPATKAFPSPVSTMTRRAGSASTLSNATWRSCSTLVLRAFIAAGRLILSTATGPSVSTTTVEMGHSSPLVARSSRVVGTGTRASSGRVCSQAPARYLASFVPSAFIMAKGPKAQRRPMVAPRSASSGEQTSSSISCPATVYTTPFRRFIAASLAFSSTSPERSHSSSASNCLLSRSEGAYAFPRESWSEHWEW